MARRRTAGSDTLTDTGRRNVLKGALASAVVGAVYRPFIGHAAEPLRVNTWGGPWEAAAKKHLFEPFTAATGIPIRTVSPVSFAKLAAQVRSGVYEFDVTTLGGGDIVRANEARLLEPLSVVPYDGALFQNGVASHAFATVLAWRTDKYKDKSPANWQDFWDVKTFPGSRSLQRYASRVLPIALLADGVAVKDLYPLNVDRAFKSLDRIKPHIRVWWTAGAQSTQILRDGEVDMIGIWHARYFEAKDAGAPVAMTWHQGEIERAYWVVAKGSPSRAQALEFVKFATSPQPLASFATQAGYGPLNPASAQFVPAQNAERSPTAPGNYAQMFEQDMARFGGDPQETAKRFEEWLSS